MALTLQADERITTTECLPFCSNGRALTTRSAPLVRSLMLPATSPQTFGSVLREYRLAAGFSQELLAERARISPQAVGALERGVRKLPQRQTLALLIEALQLEEHERARLARFAVRPAQPRRRVARVRVADVARTNVPLEPTRLRGCDVVIAGRPEAGTVPANAFDTLARICDRLERISSAIESAAAEMHMIGLSQ